MITTKDVIDCVSWSAWRSYRATMEITMDYFKCVEFWNHLQPDSKSSGDGSEFCSELPWSCLLGTDDISLSQKQMKYLEQQQDDTKSAKEEAQKLRNKLRSMERLEHELYLPFIVCVLIAFSSFQKTLDYEILELKLLNKWLPKCPS